jgi:hypothetical protein
MTISDLIASYRTEKASSYHALRFRTREHYDSLLRRIEADLGANEIGAIRTMGLIETHQAWTLRGVAMAHALVGMLRTLCSYGTVMLEDDDCAKLSVRMSAMRFKMAPPRTSRLMADQVVAIRDMARSMGLHSVSTCQAFQFDCMFRQRDVLGEWVPACEPGESEVHDGGFKWLRGITWQEIDNDLVLRHVTSKRQKLIELNLTLAPMVMQELRAEFFIVEPASRATRLPLRGPVVVSEETGKPYAAHEFRRLWRYIARRCGVPDTTFNMDSRAGAISEASDAGISLELIRHAATHSDVATTARYSRGSSEKTEQVQRLRLAHRGGV